MRVLLTPILHPSAVLQGRWPLETAQATFVRRVLKDPTSPPKDVTIPPPNSILYPTFPQLETCYAEALTLGVVAVDIESVGQWPICVGITPFSWNGTVGTPVCLRFRVQGGGLYHPWKDHLAATQWLLELMADPRVGKLFHNGVGFDVPELAHLGIRVAGEVEDTMVLVHALWSELPKGLQFLCTALLGEPLWKRLMDSEDEWEDKG